MVKVSTSKFYRYAGLGCFYFGIIILVHVVEYNKELKVTHYETNVLENKNVKVILLWNPFFSWPDYTFGLDDDAFVRNKCEVTNCVLTLDKLMVPQLEFSALVFHGFEYNEIIHGKPKWRSDMQYYVFTSLEAAPRNYIPRNLENFYNISITYRLDSDVPWRYFIVKNKTGDIVAPLLDTQWTMSSANSTENDMITKDLNETIEGKTKKVAWFVSNCHSVNGREAYVAELQKHIDVDIYGKCGPLKCTNDRHDRCNKMLSRDYYFYLSFENTNCEDYVTEKILTAVNHDTVPIVYGGANYTKFLPPNSYINANDFKPNILAKFLNELIADKNKYKSYFWWRPYYSFHNTVLKNGFKHPFCDICKIVNDKHVYQSRRKSSVRSWWLSLP